MTEKISNGTSYIRFEGAVTPEATARLTDAIQSAKERGAGEIVIIFSSLGGSIYDGFLLASTIETSKVPVRLHAVNHIDSIANVVYLSAPERTAESYAKFYLHGASTGTMSMDEPTLLDQLQSLRTNNSRIAHFISEHSDLTLAKVRALMRKGTTLTAKEAEKHKFVDRIVHLTVDQNCPLEEIVFVLPQRRTSDPAST